MLGWSINLFRIRGIQLALHVSFLVLLAYVAWQGWAWAGWAGLGWILVYVTALFTCVVLHELGHSFMARRFGVNVPRILLLPIGGMAEFDHIPRRPAQELLIAIAGPAVNVVLLGALLVLVRFPGDWEPMLFPLSLPELGRHLVIVNTVMAVFNLIPVFPMDGGRIFRALLASRLPYVRATFFAATLGKLLAIAGAAAMIFWLEHWLGAALFVFIFVAGEMEYRAVRRSEEVEAHWRAILHRLEATATPGLPPAPRF